VVFADANTGIVAGEAGTFIRTNNGGATWEQLEYTPASRGGNVLAISTALSTALAVGSDAATGGTAAWTSLDATTWTIPDDPTSRFGQPWVDVNVVVPNSTGTPNASYRLRNNGMLDLYQGGYLRSLDTTQTLTTPLSSWTTSGVTFFGLSGYGVVCGTNGGNGEIRRTSDYGSHWDVLLASTAGFPPLNRIVMQAVNSGYVCGNQGAILRTTDGTTWAQIGNQPAAATSVNFHAITFPVNAATGWAVGDGGTIYKVSEIAGNWTWTLQAVTPSTTQNLYGVAFVDNNTGYVVGDKGTVLKTTNGGATWTNISQPPEAVAFPQINAVDFDPTGQIGLAVGNGGVVLRTLDGGNTWVNFNTGVGGANLTGVCIPRSGSGQVAYICGASSTILSQSALQGLATSSWTAATPPAGSFEAIFFPKGDKNGVCVGGSTVLLTTDGATWSAPTTGPTGTFHALAGSPGGSTLYAAGDGGVIYSTVDDPTTVIQDIGNVWTVIPHPMTATPSLLSIQAPTGPNYTLIAAGNDGNVYRLSAGATPAWTSTTPLAGTTPVSLSFINDLQGWVVTQTGASTGGLLSTSSGGSVWTTSYVHVVISSTNNLNAIVMTSSEVAYAVGDGGMIIKTTTDGQ
jgi:photosystem II stability/assembly factor-like uncharacterized protein